MSLAALASPVSSLSDGALLDEQRALAAERRRVDARSAEVAGEIARRSRRELGVRGLAVREGARSPEELIQRVTGVTGREARSLTQVGSLLDDLAGGSSGAPWLSPVAAAVRDGDLGVASADAIRAGLGEPSATIAAEVLTGIARRLVGEAGGVGADRLAARAREERDAADEAGIAEREQARRDRRYLRLMPQWDGMTKVVGLLDPESAALVSDAFDRITSPRRNGPRFVDPREQLREEAIIADPRTNDQLVHDAFVEMVAVASRADEGAVFGSRAPAVRVHVRGEALARREGSGRIEGRSDAVSLETVERHTCDSGVLPIGFDTDGQVVNVGRRQRLFTTRQRIGMAARDGGCRFPGCDRPPGWTEAHHIDEFLRDEGKTDIADGVLLCRFHHMFVHNHRWRIVRERAEYYAVPPPAPGRIRERVAMPPKNRV
ncbi:MAG: DUF222 domain-containing protein [Pseudolysinimonas sp.]